MKLEKKNIQFPADSQMWRHLANKLETENLYFQQIPKSKCERHLLANKLEMENIILIFRRFSRKPNKGSKRESCEIKKIPKEKLR